MKQTPVTLKLYLSHKVYSVQTWDLDFFFLIKIFVAWGFFVGSSSIMLMENTDFIWFGIMGNG